MDVDYSSGCTVDVDSFALPKLDVTCQELLEENGEGAMDVSLLTRLNSFYYLFPLINISWNDNLHVQPIVIPNIPSFDCLLCNIMKNNLF